jgi:hypothetical protein
MVADSVPRSQSGIRTQLRRDHPLASSLSLVTVFQLRVVAGTPKRFSKKVLLSLLRP